MVTSVLWRLYSSRKRLDWFQSVSFGGQEVYLAPFENRIWVAQPAAWSLHPLSYSSSLHGSRTFRTVAACTDFCITARISIARRSNWLVYFLLLYRRRQVTIVLLCSPCRTVGSVTCEPFIISDTVFTSNIRSKVV